MREFPCGPKLLVISRVDRSRPGRVHSAQGVFMRRGSDPKSGDPKGCRWLGYLKRRRLDHH